MRARRPGSGHATCTGTLTMKTSTQSHTKQTKQTPGARVTPKHRAPAPPRNTPPAASPRDELDRQRAEAEGMTAPKNAPAAQPDERAGELEGEGSYSASRRYREGVEASVREGDTDQLAEEAAEALSGPEGRALRAAEIAGKHAKHN
jgi:hypothetical protein